MIPPSLHGLDCVVMGAGGFIGANLCRHLLAQGARVRGFDRRRSFPDAVDGAEWIQADFADSEAVAEAVRGAAVVFHLVGASLPETANHNPAADLAGSVPPSLGLLDACVRAGVGRMVFASSGGTIYGIPQSVPIAESAPTDPITAYGVSKLAIEKYLALYRRLHGLDYAILRIANPFGPFQPDDRPQGVIGALMRRALAGEPMEIWGNGEVVRDFVYVDDVACALGLAAVGQSEHRLFNVGQGVGRSINQVVHDIEAVVGRGELPKRYMPGRAVDVPVNVLDIRLIERELGWRPRADWRQALETTLAWIGRTA